jgi:hypothetical protein
LSEYQAGRAFASQQDRALAGAGQDARKETLGAVGCRSGASAGRVAGARDS